MLTRRGYGAAARFGRREVARTVVGVGLDATRSLMRPHFVVMADSP